MLSGDAENFRVPGISPFHNVKKTALVQSGTVVSSRMDDVGVPSRSSQQPARLRPLGYGVAAFSR